MKKLSKYWFVFLALFIAAPGHAETWYRADTHHFTIFSDGQEKQLEEFAHEAEKFDALMRLAFQVRPEADPAKLNIYLVSSAGDVQKLVDMNNIAGIYFARTDGSFAISNRQKTRSRDRLSGKRTLFHEYAHHFMFNNLHVPAPAWLVEGFAEFVATAEFKKNGEWYFGKPAFHRAAEIEYAPRIPIDLLLTVRPSQIKGDGASAFYGWSWALTHMLYLESPEAGKQVDRYLRRINRGETSLGAARAEFGDLDELEKELRGYVKGRMTFKKSNLALPYRDDVQVTRLSEAESATLALKLRRLGGADLAETRDALTAAAASGDAEAWYQLGRAEYDLALSVDSAADAEETSPDFSAARAALKNALAADAEHIHANVLMGELEIARLESMDQPYVEEEWKNARRYISKAAELSPRDPYALFALAQSYSRRGHRDAVVSPSLKIAFERAPESREIRFAYAIDLANNGQFEAAIQLLSILANDPHGGDAGRDAIRRIEAMRDGSTILATDIAPVVGETSDEAD